MPEEVGKHFQVNQSISDLEGLEARARPLNLFRLYLTIVILSK